LFVLALSPKQILRIRHDFASELIQTYG